MSAKNDFNIWGDLKKTKPEVYDLMKTENDKLQLTMTDGKRNELKKILFTDFGQIVGKTVLFSQVMNQHNFCESSFGGSIKSTDTRVQVIRIIFTDFTYIELPRNLDFKELNQRIF